MSLKHWKPQDVGITGINTSSTFIENNPERATRTHITCMFVRSAHHVWDVLMPTMQGKPIHTKGSKVVVGRRFISPTDSQVLAVKGCSWMMSLHCSWGSGDRKKMKETAWECMILLMEEIRLTSWYVVYPIIHKVFAPSHYSQYCPCR